MELELVAGGLLGLDVDQALGEPLGQAVAVNPHDLLIEQHGGARVVARSARRGAAGERGLGQRPAIFDPAPGPVGRRRRPAAVGVAAQAGHVPAQDRVLRPQGQRLPQLARCHAEVSSARTSRRPSSSCKMASSGSRSMACSSTRRAPGMSPPPSSRRAHSVTMKDRSGRCRASTAVQEDGPLGVAVEAGGPGHVQAQLDVVLAALEQRRPAPGPPPPDARAPRGPAPGPPAPRAGRAGLRQARRCGPGPPPARPASCSSAARASTAGTQVGSAASADRSSSSAGALAAVGAGQQRPAGPAPGPSRRASGGFGRGPLERLPAIVRLGRQLPQQEPGAGPGPGLARPGRARAPAPCRRGRRPATGRGSGRSPARPAARPPTGAAGGPLEQEGPQVAGRRPPRARGRSRRPTGSARRSRRPAAGRAGGPCRRSPAERAARRRWSRRS